MTILSRSPENSSLEFVKLFYTQGFNKEHLIYKIPLECLPFRASNSLVPEPRTGMKEVCRSGCVRSLAVFRSFK